MARKGLKRDEGVQLVFPYSTVPHEIPVDTIHLFCDECIKQYNSTTIPSGNHIRLMVHANSTDKKFKPMMPLLRAWASFIEHFTRTPVTFVFVGKEHSIPTKWKSHKITGAQIGYNVVRMIIKDDPFEDINGDRYFAYMGGGSMVVFKSGLFAGTRQPKCTIPQALTFMAHEFTAHRLSKDPEHWNDLPKHFRGHDTDHKSHCATSPFGASKCLNGFIDRTWPNMLNAIPFFEEWYNNHKDVPLRSYKEAEGMVIIKKDKRPPLPPPPKKLGKAEEKVIEELVKEGEITEEEAAKALGEEPEQAIVKFNLEQLLSLEHFKESRIHQELERLKKFEEGEVTTEEETLRFSLIAKLTLLLEAIEEDIAGFEEFIKSRELTEEESENLVGSIERQRKQQQKAIRQLEELGVVRRPEVVEELEEPEVVEVADSSKYGFNLLVLTNDDDTSDWRDELNSIRRTQLLLAEWFPSRNLEVLRKEDYNPDKEIKSDEKHQVQDAINAFPEKERRDTILVHDGIYRHSFGGKGFGRTWGARGHGILASSFSLPYLRGRHGDTSTVTIAHEWGHTLGATPKSREDVNDSSHCTNYGCVMGDDPDFYGKPKHHANWLKEKGRWDRTMFCENCIAAIEERIRLRELEEPAVVEEPVHLHNPPLIVHWKPEGQVAVVGDFHADKQTMELILAHLSKHHSEARVIFNGDKVDGRHFPHKKNGMEDFGPTRYVPLVDDLAVVNRIEDLMHDHPDKYITTQGNHERRDLANFEPAFMWEALDKLGEEGKEIREGLLEQFIASPLIIDMGEAIVAHATLPRGSTEALLSGTLTDKQTIHALWDRPDSSPVLPTLVESMKELNKTIFVCGHTPNLAAPDVLKYSTHEAWFHNENGIIMFSNQTTRAYDVSYTLLDFNKRTITVHIFDDYNKGEDPWSDVEETKHVYPFP